MELKAGFSRCDITPSYSVPLRGYGDTKGRMSKVNQEPLYATCIAISDGERNALFYHLDLTYPHNDTVAFLRKEIGERFGIPAEAIFLTATHNHSAPDLGSDMECIARYHIELREALLSIVEPALGDLEEAEMFIGTGKTDGLNFVRRYLLSDGSYGGDNFGDFQKNDILAHETDVDETMQVLRFKRKTKKDILMVNWQAHPHRTGGFRKFNLSSDVIEYFRRSVENTTKYLFSYFQGCSGNINTHSRLPDENVRQTPGFYDDENRDHRTHGKKLAETCFSILRRMRPIQAGSIRTFTTQVAGKVNHDWDDRVDDARSALALWDAGKSDEAWELAESLGFNSIYQCTAVTQRATFPRTLSIPLFGISFGDFAFVGAPNELYDTTGVYIRQSSPFEMTFVCGYTNGENFGGYLPTIKAFAHGGYGCDTCYFGAGIAEDVANAMIGGLQKLYQK